MPAVPWLSQKGYVVLGHGLAEIRVQAGVTQDELATRLQKPQSFVSSYERGQRRVDLLEFLAIVQALGQEPREAFALVVRALIRPPDGRRRPKMMPRR
jgi:transcriptional regulator with XRE-family HTH domain